VTMIGKFLAGKIETPEKKGGMDDHVEETAMRLMADYQKEMDVFAFHKALQSVFEIISILNKYIDSEAPWKLAKEGDVRVKTVMFNLWNGIRVAAVLLYPFMPVKSQLIWKALGISRQIEACSLEEEMRFYAPSDIAPIDKIPPVFPRIEETV